MGPTVHQLVPTLAVGDGVSIGAFYTQRLLQTLGCQSFIYTHRPPFELRESAFDLHLFDSSSCDLLLVHHSMGHDLETWLAQQHCAKVLVYHNITPPHYFAENSAHHFYARKGLEQLRQWRRDFVAAIGDSPLNSRILTDHGYGNVTSLPLLVDFERLGGEAVAPPWHGIAANRPLILSVGRLCPNKRQDLLVDALAALKRLLPAAPPLLVLAGPSFKTDFDQQVERRIRHWGLDSDVVLTGFIDDIHLRWLYQHSAVYWCASEHEGFCMPLIEAGYYRVPTVAFASSNIPDTLGESGLLLDMPNPDQMAATTLKLLTDTHFCQQVAQGAAQNLQRFREQDTREQLRTFLQQLGLLPVQHESR